MKQTSELKQLTTEEFLQMSRDMAEHAIKKVMKEFNFAKAALALRGCGWKYVGAAKSPSALDLEKIARKIVRDAIQAGAGCTISSGPLEAKTQGYETPSVVTVTLSLKPVWSSDVYIDGRVILAKRGRKAALAVA